MSSRMQLVWRNNNTCGLRGGSRKIVWEGHIPWRARGMWERPQTPYNGGLGAEPPAGSRGRAPGGGQGGEAPLKLKAFWLVNVPRSRKIDPDFVFCAKCSLIIRDNGTCYGFINPRVGSIDV